MRTTTLTLALAALLNWLPPPAHAQWTNDPYNGMVPVCTVPAPQTNIRMAALAGGRTFIAWGDDRTYPVVRGYYQVLDSFGNPLLTINGELLIEGTWITAWPSVQSSVIPDNEGGCIAIFEDYRSGPRQIYGQRFDSLGNPLWGAAGLPMITEAGSEIGLKDVEKDSLGNGFIACAQGESPINEIYVQKFVLTTGERLWGDHGIVDCGGIALCDYQQLVADGHGGVYDAWADSRHGQTSDPWHLYAQHLDANGNALWMPNGIPVRNPSSGNILPGDGLVEGLTDGQGGGVWAYVPPMPSVIKAFRLLPTGRVVWIDTWDLYFNLGLWKMLHHPSDGTIWLCCQANWPYRLNFYLFRLAPRTGFLYFGEEGLPWGGMTMTAVSHGVITVDYEYGLQYGEQRSRLGVKRVTSTGELLWRTYAALSGPLPNHDPAFGDPLCVSDGADGAICAWEDLRNYAQTGIDIYAQRVQWNGRLGNPTTPPQDIPSRAIGAISASAGAVNYVLTQPGEVKLELFDILGRRVALLEEGYKLAGSFKIHLEQFHLPSGVYLVSISTPQERRMGKVVIWH